MNITADMVKQLRDMTGAGMMDCKKALSAAEGNIELAMENLRKSGIAKAEKKASRNTSEGKIASLIEGQNGVLLEVLCETDFVATNEKFKTFVDKVLATTMAQDADGDVVGLVQEAEKDNLVTMIATIGENMQIRRAVRWASAGKVASYLHMGGRIGVMVDVEGEGADEAFLHDLCMHIAAFKPQFIDSSDVPQDVIEKEKEIAAAADPKLANKPKEMLDKILAGKINKFFTEICLVKQPWIHDDKSCLAAVRPNVKVKRFVRWEVGQEL